MSVANRRRRFVLPPGGRNVRGVERARLVCRQPGRGRGVGMGCIAAGPGPPVGPDIREGGP